MAFSHLYDHDAAYPGVVVAIMSFSHKASFEIFPKHRTLLKEPPSPLTKGEGLLDRPVGHCNPVQRVLASTRKIMSIWPGASTTSVTLTRAAQIALSP